MAKICSADFQLENIDGVLLDKDGTITDSHLYWCELIRIRTTKILEKYKIDKKFSNKISESMGLDVKNNKLLPQGPIAIKSRTEVIVSIIECLNLLSIESSEEELSNLFIEANKFFKSISYDFIKPIKSAVNFIEKLKSHKLKIALVTSDSKDNAYNSMKKIGIEDAFDLYLGGDSNVGNKKTGEPATYACKKLGLTPKNVIAIGDAQMDFDMAFNAGLKGSILVSTGQNTINQLKKINYMSIKSLDYLSITSE